MPQSEKIVQEHFWRKKCFRRDIFWNVEVGNDETSTFSFLLHGR